MFSCFGPTTAQAAKSSSWVERGVAVNRKAARRGYGTELIQEALAYALEADVDYDLAADGVRCRIAMPVGQPE